MFWNVKNETRYRIFADQAKAPKQLPAKVKAMNDPYNDHTQRLSVLSTRFHSTFNIPLTAAHKQKAAICKCGRQSKRHR
jgi:hypothetical protein